jgi:manganese-dependent inorganic pyrophosphatase
MKKFLITASKRADLDGVACGIAYQSFLSQKDPANQYFVKFHAEKQVEVDFVLGELGLKTELIDDNESFDGFILVDMCETLGLPEVVKLDKVIELIDHRLYPDYQSFPNAKWRIEPVGAAATQIAEFFYFDESIELTSTNAALLLCAIYSNTINFKSDTTTFRDLRMKNWLESKLEAKDKDLPERMYDYKTKFAIEHLEEIMRLDMHDDGNTFGGDIVDVIYQIETGNADELINRKDEIFGLFKKIKPEREYQLLIIQDATNGKTFILSDREGVKNALNQTNLNGKLTDNVYAIEGIRMRKSVKKALLERT